MKNMKQSYMKKLNFVTLQIFLIMYIHSTKKVKLLNLLSSRISILYDILYIKYLLYNIFYNITYNFI
jgi:hypothetical protein